jgi:plastocyanin
LWFRGSEELRSDEIADHLIAEPRNPETMRNIPLLLLIFASNVLAPPVTVTVTIDQVAFREKSVTARVGDTIEWVNKDIFDHTATAKNGAFNVEVPAGKKARIVLKKAEAIDYFCELHPNMTAKIVVEKAGASRTTAK